jgi:hypothetical protein
MRAAHTDSNRKNAQSSKEVFLGSEKFLSPWLKMRLLEHIVRGIMRFEFVQLLRRTAFRLRIFVGSNGIVRLQKALSIQMPKRFGMRQELRTGGESVRVNLQK